MPDLGTVTHVEETFDVIKKITFTWLSVNGGGDAGKAQHTTDAYYTGKILRVVTAPGGAAPSLNYDVYLKDSDGYDAACGQLINRSDTATETVTASMGYVAHSQLTLYLEAAGNAKTGTVVVYIGGAGDAIVVDDTAKIDALATSGLLGTANSLAYRVHEIERHVHSRERWVGIKAVPTATDWADDTLTGFVAISGNGVYGADLNDEALVLGADDTPAIVGMVKFDVHQINISSATSTTPYKLRFVYGTGTLADAIAAGQFTETMIRVSSDVGRMGTSAIRMPRLAAGTQVWVQCKNATNNATVTFFVGLHEYEG
jgi:hypothetical protein